MTIIGPENLVKHLSENLNPQLLAELMSDILATKGHTSIKIVDGPGDGCRDIHSLDSDGNQTLSQCKFHQDASKTVSSKEMGELPMGMIKMSYTNGVFVTNGQISPQAKREYLNDYRSLALNYIDGRELVTIVLDNAVLKALWFDGEKIGRVSSTLVVPVIARNLTIDMPIPIIPETMTHQDIKLRKLLLRDFANIDINIKYENPTPISIFAPYRPPKVRTINEGTLYDIRATEIIVSGLVPLERIDEILQVLAFDLLGLIEVYHQKQYRAVAVRVGIPSLSVLSGESAGTRLLLPFQSISYVSIDGKKVSEHEWLQPGEEIKWEFPKQIRGSQFNQTRIYNTALNACIEYGLISIPSEKTRHSIIERREAFSWYWEQSLFAIIPTTRQEDRFYVKLPLADFMFDWIGETEFRGWLYGDLSQGVFMSTADEPDSDEDNLLHDSFRRSPASELHLQEIKKVIELIGGEIIAPIRARHIVAAVMKDPYPSEEKVLYGTFELITHPDDIPSPIDPSSRRLEMTVCWHLGVKNQELDVGQDEIIVERVKDILFSEMTFFSAIVYTDRDTSFEDIYLIVTVEEPIKYDLFCHVDLRIARFTDLLSPVLEKIEEELKETFANMQRATRKYWYEEFSMPF